MGIEARRQGLLELLDKEGSSNGLISQQVQQ